MKLASPKHVEQYTRLSPSRRTIIREFFSVRTEEHRSTFHVVKKITKNLGYAEDQNGASSHVMKVVREFFRQGEGSTPVL